MRVCQFRHFGPESVVHNTQQGWPVKSRATAATGRSRPIAERGLTLIPLRLYFKHGRAKVELGLGRGKKLHDKRATVRERDQRREMDQAARTMTRAGGPRRRSHDDEE